jgi:hypothetical protein
MQKVHAVHADKKKAFILESVHLETGEANMLESGKVGVEDGCTGKSRRHLERRIGQHDLHGHRA